MARPKLAPDFEPTNMGENPFVKNLVVRTREVTLKKTLYDPEDSDDNVIVRVGEKRSFTFMLESDRYTKVYHSSDTRKAIASLPARAKELLMWLHYVVRIGKDYVVMNIALYKSENNVSHTTYLKAVDDLIQANIIFATRWAGVFWINPSIFFCGSRMTKYKDNIEIVQYGTPATDKKDADTGDV